MRFTRERYQSGCLTREERKTGPSVWVLQMTRNQTGGQNQRKVVVRSVEEHRTKAAALKAVEALRVNINAEIAAPVTINQLVTHCVENEFPTKAFSTQRCYRVYLKIWILPKWGRYGLSDVRTVAVEAWLHNLPLSNGSKAKIRNIMSALFNHAIRYEWMARNPAH